MINPDIPIATTELVDSPEWTQLLSEWSKFKFSTEQGYFTAYKGKNGHFTAQRRIKGKLHHAHLGIAPDLAKLTEVAAKLGGPVSETTESHSTTEPSESSEVTALKERISYLLDERGLIQAKARADAQVRITQLEKRIKELDDANWELQKQLTTATELSCKRLKEIQVLQSELNVLQAFKSTPVEQPSVSNLLTRYEEEQESIKKNLPSPPKDLPRNRLSCGDSRLGFRLCSATNPSR